MSRPATSGLIVMVNAKEKMWSKYSGLIFLSLIWNCCALHCRSDGGPKENELRAIYKSCLKKHEGKNMTNNRGYDDDRRDSRNRQKSPWDRDVKFGSNDRNDEGYGWDRNRDDRKYDDRMDRNDKMGNRDDRNNYDSRMNNGYDRSSYDDRMSNRNDRINNYDERIDRMGRDGMGRNGMGRDGMGRDGMGRDGMGYGDRMGRTDGYGRSQVSAKDAFQQSDEYDPYRSSTTSPRRYKRSKSMNSGQRSQYNPNPAPKKPFDESYKSDEKNSTENSSKKADAKACALHCFLENLEMIGDNGMPDRYLVTHAITKDVKNEDLRDFLQESIEECFQILDNENTEDKCEFSKNLLMCLSEKGRANCDDWKDDIQF